jgi:hypothetical protein
MNTEPPIRVMGRDDKKKRTKNTKNSKKRSSHDDDDDSVDSKGNIRGLIDYDYDSDESYIPSPVISRKSKSKTKSSIATRTRAAKRKVEASSRKSDESKHSMSSKQSKTSKHSIKSSESKNSTDSKNSKKSKDTTTTHTKKNIEKLLGRIEECLDGEMSDSNSDTKNELVTTSTSEKQKKKSSEKEKDKKGFIPRNKGKNKKATVIDSDTSESSEMDEVTEGEEEDEEEEDENTDSDTEYDEEDEDEDYEEDDDEDYEEDDSEYDDDEDYYDDDDEMEGGKSKPPGLIFSFGSSIDESDKLIPKRHNMKKESDEVKKFVKLITQPSDENTIDCQIDQFKALPVDQKKKLLDTLEIQKSNPAAANPQQSLMFKILTMSLPVETQSMVLNKYNSLQLLDPASSEYFKMRNWLEKLTSLPLGLYRDIPVKVSDGQETCGAFMEKARRHLDEAIYGQDEAKLQVLQFIGTKISNPTGRGLSLLLAGPPGIGKTSLIKNGIAKALNWPFQFISLGGDSDASTYTGHQLVYESSHCGKIVNSLAAAKSMSMVLMFDEADKISTTPKGEEVQHLLIHLTDPVQNGDFEDKYLSGIPIDLSRVMFVFSANDLGRIDKVLLDRFTVIQLQGYSQKEKLTIAEKYLLPDALKQVDLVEKIGITKDALQYVIDEYAKEESGVRELKRCIDQIVQKLNMLRMFNTDQLPFHIKNFSLPFMVKKEHIDLFLKKKKSTLDESALRMYT